MYFIDNSMSTSKNSTLNIGYALKGALILCVLFGHSISMINGIRGGSWSDSPVNILLTSFEMPMFTLVSGYYMGSSLSRHSAATVFFRRVLSIGTTLLCWVIIPTAVKLIIFERRRDVFGILRSIFDNTVGGNLWYLFTYLFCSLILLAIVGFTAQFFKRSTKIEMVTLCIATVLVPICKWIPGYSPFLFPFFVVGYGVFRYSIIEKSWFPNILRVCTVVFLILIPFYTPEVSFYMLSPAITDIFMVPEALFRTIVGLSGGVVAYVIVRYLMSNSAANGLEKLGKNSLALYILSMYIQVPMRDIIEYILPQNCMHFLTDYSIIGFGVIFCVILIGICTLVNKLLMRFKPLYKLLLS